MSHVTEEEHELLNLCQTVIDAILQDRHDTRRFSAIKNGCYKIWEKSKEAHPRIDQSTMD